ncbi:MAG: hypothetical protein Q7U72_13530 [Brevundimonas sp.]|jgi:hypothetical protein|uniref:hypothetical protein n=1 Tax=Brevundimonas sp. TaxID=1871086 RepID=UPI00271FB2AA|nr:hypothetical protein [Brevundimonas sp.]MBU4135422.1 hypothetical protein [Alphaproteobacteria bacterium]MDO9078453.1 hypothetical protein [Brevundimonas sp.]MDZ4061957.1 hypothetical protein [Brevundimonas sp.]
MSVVHSLRHRARPFLLGVFGALSLASCQAEPSHDPSQTVDGQSQTFDGQSQTVDGLRLEYGVVDSATVAAHPRSHPESGMHDGPPSGTDHVTLAVFDAATNRRIDDAEVSLSISGPHNPGPGAGPLELMPLDGFATYGGYVSLRRPGRYLLTFHVARPGRRDDPVRAVFAYERS